MAFVYICSDLPLKPFLVKGTIICIKYTLMRNKINIYPSNGQYTMKSIPLKRIQNAENHTLEV